MNCTLQRRQMQRKMRDAVRACFARCLLRYVRRRRALGMWWRAHRRSMLRAVLGCIVVAAAVLLRPMDVAPYLACESSGEMLDRDGRLMYAFLNEREQWCFPRDLDAISRYLVQATIATEDQHFHKHFGVDPLAVLRAACQNVRAGHVVSGASTLSMQVVKLTDGPGRSLLGKVRQAIQAVRLECRVDKSEILTAYLNRTPYGLNLSGCEAAARRYFGKTAAELTLPEAALLAGLPKSPASYQPLSHPERAQARRNYVLRRMCKEGFISERRCETACETPLGVRWNAFPQLAPHLAMRLRSALASGGRIMTSLDYDVQRAAEQSARRWLSNFGGGIGNAALIIVDVPTTSVLARVGSADFFNTPGGGQVDVCRAARSPGSALKPFVYALSMERESLYASEMLFDGPLDYGLYDPENYDGNNCGLVTASSALKRSLNVPAITVLERVGIGPFCEFLKSLGITTLDRTAAHYGLGLVIGSCEVRLDELAAAYCMLANLGEYRPLRTLTDAPPSKPARMLSRGTCLKIYEMLEQALPAEVHCGAMPAVGADPRVCWKTGTSTKHRDAWSFVFNRQYLVGVWMGNNDSTPSRCLVGAEAALPLAGQQFRSLSVRNTPSWPEGGGDLRGTAVCARSGLPRSEWCRHTRQVLLPRSQYKHRICDVHYPMVRGRGEERNVPVQVVERWPGAARGWNLAQISAPLRRRDIARSQAASRRKVVQIIAPADKAEYVLTNEADGDRLTLQASLDRDASLHWYLDDRYLGKSQPERTLTMALKSGRHTVACMAEDGTVDVVSFDVLSPSRSPILLD